MKIRENEIQEFNYQCYITELIELKDEYAKIVDDINKQPEHINLYDLIEINNKLIKKSVKLVLNEIEYACINGKNELHIKDLMKIL